MDVPRSVLVFLALLPVAAAAGAGDPGCRIRRAEATVCPAFQVIESNAALAVSGDGRTVVGSVPAGDPDFPTDSLPMRWVDGQPRPLSGLPAALRGFATAASRDAAVIAGSAFLRGDVFVYRTFRWRAGTTELLDGGFGLPREPVALSGDGSVMATARDLSGARWTEETGVFESWVVGLGYLDGQPGDVSDDGETIVGYAFGGPAEVAPFQWTGDVTTPLPLPPGAGGPNGGLANGISPDGSVSVGVAARDVLGTGPDDCGPANPCGAVWRDGIVDTRDHSLQSASWDGAFLLENQPQAAALVETASDTVRTLDEILDALGVERDHSAWWGEDFSYDGHVVVGRTGPLSGDPKFRAVISPKLGIDIQPRRRHNRIDLWHRRPIVVRIYGSAQADATQVDVATLRFGPDRAAPVRAFRVRDWNRDGHADRDFVFEPGEAGLAFGDREACVTGVASGLPFRLCSRVETAWGGWHPLLRFLGR